MKKCIQQIGSTIIVLIISHTKETNSDNVNTILVHDPPPPPPPLPEETLFENFREVFEQFEEMFPRFNTDNRV